MAAAKPKTLRWVCDACGGVYHAPINDACPGCKGHMREREVRYNQAGVAHVVDEDE